jgi:hypothetical protein
VVLGELFHWNLKIQELKDLLQCDIVLRKDGYLLYCEQIPEAEIVE